jgi:hypothetical protein
MRRAIADSRRRRCPAAGFRCRRRRRRGVRALPSRCSKSRIPTRDRKAGSVRKMGALTSALRTTFHPHEPYPFPSCWRTSRSFRTIQETMDDAVMSVAFGGRRRGLDTGRSRGGAGGAGRQPHAFGACKPRSGTRSCGPQEREILRACAEGLRSNMSGPRSRICTTCRGTSSAAVTRRHASTSLPPRQS